MIVDCDYPGGNIIVDAIDGDNLAVHQDLRDTVGDWFWWNFRVREAAGRTITVTFTKSNVIGVLGPAISLDGGATWAWLGAEAVEGQSFRYSVPGTAGEARFAFGMPYLQANLEQFLSRHAASPYLAAGTLCKTKKGRNAELLRLGKIDGSAPIRILLTCRHHCCEAAASYSLEGIMETILTDADTGAWYRQNVEVMVVPFVDKDGVEDGDQGKNRAPRDHNRDYSDASVHPTTAAMRDQVPAWGGGKLRFALDMHCPWIRGQHNEDIYFPGGSEPTNWARVVHFGEIIERVQTGPLVFSTKNNLPFGQAWNVASNSTQGASFGRWAATIPGISVAASIEIPYANASGVAVTPDTARAFGHDLAKAIAAYLQEPEPARPAESVITPSGVLVRPVSIGGTIPSLAVRADMMPARSETGIGALMPWAGKLWFVTYPSHKRGTGAGTGLFEVDDHLTLHKRPESIVGTYANRLVHHQSNQLIIGPHIIDVQGNVRNLPDFADHRLAATMLHLTDPDNMVYFLTMEGLLFEANVHTLAVKQLFDLRIELDIHPQARLHFKGGHTAQGRVVVANNSYYEADFAPKAAPAATTDKAWRPYEADSAGIPPAGRLAEWDGTHWTILERKPFNEVAGRTNWGEVIFATGWDRASAILKVLVSGQWQTYRLPKASHTWEHCWQTEWPRIREIESERYLMDASGMFYELSPVAWDGRIWGVRPIATHLRIIPDYCSWLGFLVLGGNQNTPIGDTNPVVGEAQANLWLGKSDDLWSFGKPKGWGGPWWETPVQAGETSDPFLMTGFEHKVLHVYHDAPQVVAFTVEVDFLGNGTWKTYARIPVAAGGYEHHEFPSGFSAHWVRVRAERACAATAYFMYT